MRAREFIREMPLRTMQRLGSESDWKKPKGFAASDIKLLKNPKHQVKAIKFFENTPYNFRVFFDNRTKNFYPYGEADSRFDWRKFFSDEDIQLITSDTNNAITVIYEGNPENTVDFINLTPWMMAHRFSHALEESWKSRQTLGIIWREVEKFFYESFVKILVNFYHIGDQSDLTPVKMPAGRYTNAHVGKYKVAYASLFNSIGTQRSSRQGQINSEIVYEFLNELFTQYLATGQVKLNPLPAMLASDHPMDPEFQSQAGQITQKISSQLSVSFDNLLDHAVGKIFLI